ncbi:hypothetical protein F9B44_11615 [Staphylococcus epidermidis]|nr:hypothetical protein F9B44_11615 [Staphylococcus epidermidis]MCG2093797.1 hypothetical protein [Staphylococcus epidermidis]
MKIEWVKETLNQYKSIEPCNFNNDLNFWIEYIENVDKKPSPFDTNTVNDENFDVFYELFDQSKSIKDLDIISSASNHIRLYKNKIVVKGIFCVPIVNERIYNTKKSILKESNTDIVSQKIL